MSQTNLKSTLISVICVIDLLYLKVTLILEQVNILDDDYFDRIPDEEAMLSDWYLEDNTTASIVFCDNTKILERRWVAVSKFLQSHQTVQLWL